jgi:hypothetical protein
MSLYQCDECGCCENTALGWYHCRNVKDMVDPKFLGKKLCSACGPTHYVDGKKIGKMGKWHGKFERRFYPKGTMETDDVGNLKKKSVCPSRKQS